MHSSFGFFYPAELFEIHLCCCMYSSFLFIPGWYSIGWVYHNLFIHLPVDTFGLFLVFDYDKYSSCEHLCINRCMDIWSHFSWINNYLEVERLHYRLDLCLTF